MPRIKVDLDGVRSFSIIPPGTYRCRLESVEEATSQSGNPMLVWDWVVSEGPQKGKSARSWTVLNEDALGSLKDHLSAFGYGGEVDMDVSELEGRELLLSLGVRDYISDDGEKRQSNEVLQLQPVPDDREVPGGSGQQGEVGEDEEVQAEIPF